MPVRDIDFAAIRNLRGRYGMACPRGRVIFREGDTSTDFYVVLQGAVDMVVRDAATGQPTVVRTARAGEFFGEMACFCEQPRTATAVVREDAVLLCLGQGATNDLLRSSPKFARGVIQSLCDRLTAGSAAGG